MKKDNEKEKSKEQFLEEVRIKRKDIDYLIEDYNGLKEALSYLRLDGAKEADAEYIVDEMDKDLKLIKSLEEEYEQLLREHRARESENEEEQFQKNDAEEQSRNSYSGER